jgi:hypothetical protein
MSLQVQFKPVSFPVKEVVVNTVENRRGQVLGYNIVARGVRPNEQAIVDNVGVDEGKVVVDQHLSAARTCYVH